MAAQWRPGRRLNGHRNPLPVKLTALERRAALALALVVGLRMFGLFLILPVFAVQARAYPDATAWLIGLAIGVYGIGQAVLQFPFGWLSDRIGRRPTISIGLVLFAAGGLVAAVAGTLKAVVLGRALQGMGAVSGAGLALAADLSREPVRAKVMAIIGASIGAGFVLALVVGAPLYALGGLGFLFALTSILALLALLLLWLLVPQPPAPVVTRESAGAALRTVVADRRLMLLNLSVFVLHALLTAAFVTLPGILTDRLDLPLTRHWEFYLPAMAVAALGLGVFAGGRRGSLVDLGWRQITALALCAAGLALFALSGNVLLIGVAGCAFFTGFTALEALLPTLVSRLAPAHERGAALGAYASLQFLGAFAGGLGGGMAMGRFGESGVLLGAAALAALWCLVLAWLPMRIARSPMAVDDA